MEVSAITVLTRAVELDTNKRFTEALVCYEQGLQLLMGAIKVLKDETKKARFRQKASEYMDRAEQIKDYVEKEKDAGKYHEQIHIADNSVGYSYEQVFGRFLDEMVSCVFVEDPYIRNDHQVYNFLRLSELLVKKCRNLTRIQLTTSTKNGPGDNNQQEHLLKVAQSLASRNIKLVIDFSSTLHDREMRLDNGWVIKIGRGLDYFKPVTKFSLGYCDYDLRPCHETTVDVFHRKFTRSSSSTNPS